MQLPFLVSVIVHGVRADVYSFHLHLLIPCFSCPQPKPTALDSLPGRMILSFPSEGSDSSIILPFFFFSSCSFSLTFTVGMVALRGTTENLLGSRQSPPCFHYSSNQFPLIIGIITVKLAFFTFWSLV